MTPDNTNAQNEESTAPPGTIQSYGFSPAGQSGSVTQAVAGGQQSSLQQPGGGVGGSAVSTQPVQSPQAGLGSTPQIADDTDLIEKEWVLKAKEIVERTHDDPYKQNEAIHRLKADYMKKRYSKDIKLSNG